MLSVIVSLILIFLLIVIAIVLVYRRKIGLLKEKDFWTPFIAVILGISSLIQSTYKYAVTVEIEKKVKRSAVKTANLVALMSSYEGWGLQSIPIREERLNFYRSSLEGASELLISSGENPDDYQSIKELKGVIIKFEQNPKETPVTRPSSEELESLAEKSKQTLENK